MVTTHVLHTPMHEHKRVPAGDRWCFHCRKRLPHEDVLWVCDDPMSFYGPHWQRQCSRCHEDHTNFPGTCW